MKRSFLIPSAAALALALSPSPATAQSHSHDGVTLHVNPRWAECSIQLDPALTQTAWRQFTREAGLVAYFRPLSDARPMGRGSFEVSMLQWDTAIDDSDAAWNDTFVHPDSTHWLHDGSGLKFPGLMIRAGATANTDVGLYLTKNPRANYGFFGGQVQHNLVGAAANPWAASARLSFVSLYGPEDVDLNVYGAELIASRTFTFSRRVTMAPYAGMSTYLSATHEKSPVVALDDERAVGTQVMVGATLELSKVKLAAEYNAAAVRSISLKVGIGH